MTHFKTGITIVLPAVRTLKGSYDQYETRLRGQALQAMLVDTGELNDVDTQAMLALRDQFEALLDEAKDIVEV